MRSFLFTIGQGFRYLFRNKVFALASIATITSCLFMLGVMYSIVLNFRHMVQSVEEGVSVTVFFQPGTTEDIILQRKVEIEEREEVATVNYVSAEDAWEQFKVDYLGDYSDGFTENPLEDMSNLEVYLSDVSKQNDLIDFLRSLPEVGELNYSAITADTLSGANSLIGYISAGIVLILFAVSVFLISNTIATGISVRKEEISIMKYIGATDFFVRAPFVIEGIIIGVIGSITPLGIIYVLYNKAVEYITTRFPSFSRLFEFLPWQEIFRTLGPIAIVLGVGIGFVGSMMTVRRHMDV